MNRRTLLATAGTMTVGSLAGCGFLSDKSAPAGSLRFENNHGVPHSIRIEVTGVGDEAGDEPGEVTGDVTAPDNQRTLTAANTLDPQETKTYESVFTEPIYYGVQFTIDGNIPESNAGTAVFRPGHKRRENVGNAGRKSLRERRLFVDSQCD